MNERPARRGLGGGYSPRQYPSVTKQRAMYPSGTPHARMSAFPSSLSNVSSARATIQEDIPSADAYSTMFSTAQKASGMLYRKFFGAKTMHTQGAP